MDEFFDDEEGPKKRPSTIRRTGIIVPARQSSYGKTPEWVEKSTKDFLDNIPTRNHLKSLNYTKPDLRDRLKSQIMAGSKGGRSGQWSARKAQLLALAYRKAGGGYRGKPGKAQRSLKKWTKERWTTVDGKPALRRGKMSRYLPAAAWRRLSPEQRKATVAKKLAGDKRGRQFVPNTQRAASASKKIRNRKAAVDSSPSIKSDNQTVNEERMSHEAPTVDRQALKPAKMPDGSMASIKPIVFEHNNMHVVVPTITESGELLSDSQAIEKYLSSNWHLGKFGDRRAASRYASLLKDTDIENMDNQFTEVDDGHDDKKSKRRFIDASAVKRNDNNRDDKPTGSKPAAMKRNDYLAMFGGS